MERKGARRNSGTALITGATSGMGLELARVFAEKGHDLVLVGRNAGKLREVKTALESKHGVTVETIAQDLAEPRAAEEIFKRTQEKGLRIDFLVNNAGFATHGNFHESDLRKLDELFNVNERTPIVLTRLFLPGMLERKRGKILNISSTAAFGPLPEMPGYGATKTSLRFFSHAIAEEYKGKGVSVTVLTPGAVRTPFAKKTGIEGTWLYSRLPVLEARKVALAGYKAMMKGRREASPGALSKAFAVSGRILPVGVAAKIAKRLLKTRK